MEQSSPAVLETNVTVQQIANALNLNISNVTSEISDNVTNAVFNLYDDYRQREREHLFAFRYVALVMSTLIIVSNLIVVISSGLILRKGQQPKSTYLLLGNVSLADTIIGFSIIFDATAKNITNNDMLCVFQIGMIAGPTMVSIFSVGLIAIDRYVYILHGLYYQRWINATRVRIGIVIIWIIGLVIGCLPAMGLTDESFSNYRCWYITVFPSSLLIMLSVIALTVIVMVCVLYFLILRRAVRVVNDIRTFKETRQKVSYVNRAYNPEGEKDNEFTETAITISVNNDAVKGENENEIELERTRNSGPSRQWHKRMRKNITKFTCSMKAGSLDSSNPSKLKAIKTVILLTACFMGTWAPYYVAVIVYVKCNLGKGGYACIPIETVTLGPLYYLGVSSSLCDPLIYAWWHTGFKRTITKIVCKCLWKTKIYRSKQYCDW